jgi:hypothetical protein
VLKTYFISEFLFAQGSATAEIMSRKGLSAEEKRTRMMQIFYEKKEFFQLRVRMFGNGGQ